MGDIARELFVGIQIGLAFVIVFVLIGSVFLIQKRHTPAISAFFAAVIVQLSIIITLLWAIVKTL
jgi:hypothetical protein